MTFDEHELNESFKKMFESFEKYISESSGWVLKKVLHLIVHTVIYSPLSGSSYIQLPQKLRHSRSVLNIRNEDQKCFLWNILASLHPSDSPLVSDYEVYENELNMRDINYPVSINRIKKFESSNPSISVNVFACENGEIVPLRITKEKDKFHHLNLLLLKTDTTSHYCLIKDLNSFLRLVQKNSNCSNFCHYCLHEFTNETLLKEHLPYCQVHDKQRLFSRVQRL